MSRIWKILTHPITWDGIIDFGDNLIGNILSYSFEKWDSVKSKGIYKTKIAGYSNTNKVLFAIFISAFIISGSIFYLGKKLEDVEKSFYLWTDVIISHTDVHKAHIAEEKAFRSAVLWNPNGTPIEVAVGGDVIEWEEKGDLDSER